MLSPRWTKLRRDVMLTPGRIALIVLAMAAGVCGLATMLGSYTILSRETTSNYLATNPPSATLQLDRIDKPLLDAVRAFPGIKAAQAGALAHAVLDTGHGPALPLAIFVVEDFNALQINTVFPEAGAWPPPPGTLLMEREALRLVDGHIGDRVNVRSGNGAPHQVTLAGTVHDPSLPPATRGQTVYAFATPATVAALGLDGTLRQLKLTVREQALDVDAIEATVTKLAVQLQRQGYVVDSIRIPPPGEHPHQKVMNSILIMLSVFSAVAVVLSAVLSATVLGGMLAQQTRQIGVMKAIGASGSQIAVLYLALVAVLALFATVLGSYAGLAGARAFSSVVLQQMLNFTMHDATVPDWVLLALALAGIVVPLAIAALPIAQATRATVKAALDDAGSRRQYFAASAGWLARTEWLDRTLVMAMRNSLRRRGRLLMTVGLLAASGAMYMSSVNVRAASQQHLVQAAADRHHDLELVLRRPAPVAQVLALIGALDTVALAEPWEHSATTRQRPDGLQVERVYPDGTHGTLALAAVPEPNATLRLDMLSGSWLAAGQSATAVLNSAALEFFPHAKVGDDIALAAHGRAISVRVTGIARQYMAPATVFVSRATYDGLAGHPGLASSFRVVLHAHDAQAIDAAARRIEGVLRGAGIEVALSVTETMLRKDVDGHFDLLLAAMMFISILMAAVGVFGLGSAMSSSVAERSREFGIMRSIGARSAVVLRNVLCEGVCIAVMSVPLALLLALPLSAAIGAFLGNLLFGLAFPLAVSLQGILTWLLVVMGCALVASGIPAWKAARLSIHQALTSI